MKGRIFILILTAAIFSSCASQRDVTIDRQRLQMDEDLGALEDLIVPLEAAAAPMQSDISAARRLITDLERNASADSYFSGRLSAWSGRLAILEGRQNEALRLHGVSQAAAPGNIPSIILGILLAGDHARRLELAERELQITGPQPSAPGFGELHIERGRALLGLNRFAEAAGAFDMAFASPLRAIYSSSYQRQRNMAWEMRDAASARDGTLGILGREGITWIDSISIARNETQLLRFISGGRDLSEGEFFNRLLERGFIPYTQNVQALEWPLARPNQNDLVTRAGAAWLIWHLYAEARADRSLLTRYSARFSGGTNPRSPIADIPALSPFFDSILGTVETELLNLPDGRNFRPEEPIRGAELLGIFRRIDN
ncbi:MAG: hypothetical protein FWH12_02140 [Treponema sp.]|nr:hypothetical protein [Treponema sp.]